MKMETGAARRPKTVCQWTLCKYIQSARRSAMSKSNGGHFPPHHVPDQNLLHI